MANNQSKLSGGSQPPTEAGNTVNNPKDPKEKKQAQQEGDIRKVDRAHDKKESYGDDYDVQQENEIAKDEAKSEKANRPGRR